MVVVFGPPGAGKSRSAFEAVRRNAGDATVLMPEDAKGLKSLVMHKPSSVLEPGGRGVLWLEGLEHYIEGLDLDALLRFLEWADSSPVILVATIRDDALEGLLQSAARDGLVIRRLLSHGRGIFVSGDFSNAELGAFKRHHGHPPDGPSVVAAFPRSWRGGWAGCAPTPGPAVRPRQRTIDGPTAGLSLLFVTLLIALFIFAGRYGWTVAPPVDVQVAELAAPEAEGQLSAPPAMTRRRLNSCARSSARSISRHLPVSSALRNVIA